MKLSQAVSFAVHICMTAALDETRGNVKQAAVIVGVNRTQFYKIAARHGVTLRKPRVNGAAPELANWRRA